MRKWRLLLLSVLFSFSLLLSALNTVEAGEPKGTAEELASGFFIEAHDITVPLHTNYDPLAPIDRINIKLPDKDGKEVWQHFNKGTNFIYYSTYVSFDGKTMTAPYSGFCKWFSDGFGRAGFAFDKPGTYPVWYVAEYDSKRCQAKKINITVVEPEKTLAAAQYAYELKTDSLDYKTPLTPQEQQISKVLFADSPQCRQKAEIKRVVHYVDEAGKQLFPDTEQLITYNFQNRVGRNMACIDVTSKPDRSVAGFWRDFWTCKQDTFAAVTIPEKEGYTHDLTAIPACKVTLAGASETELFAVANWRENQNMLSAKGRVLVPYANKVWFNFSAGTREYTVVYKKKAPTATTTGKPAATTSKIVPSATTIADNFSRTPDETGLNSTGMAKKTVAKTGESKQGAILILGGLLLISAVVYRTGIEGRNDY